MAAATQNFTIEQGANFGATVTWKDSSGTPINLTGYTARMQARPSITSPDPPTISLTDSAGLTLGGSAGTIEIAMSATETAALGAGSYVYDLEMVSGSGFVTRLLKGAITVDPEVTR